MHDVLVFILGGGRGARLFPLTKHRSEPAVPIAGKYRLIDIPISNCINSEFHKIYVLTQYMSVSLHRHIANAYKFTQFSRGFVEVLAAQQTNEKAEWFRGTADAIRQNLRYVEADNCRDVVILSGDQLYRMDFRKVLHAHRERDADLTLAVLPTTAEQAGNYGIVRVDATGRIIRMVEKPQAPEELLCLRSAREYWPQAKPSPRGEYLANMGIYFFKRKTLLDMLARHSQAHDLVTGILTESLTTHEVQAYLFDGYWEDVGSMKTYFEANLALTIEQPPFDFHAQDGLIYTRMRDLPASRVQAADVEQSLVSDGCLVETGTKIRRSVIGVRSRIGKNCHLHQVIVLGANYYESETGDDSAYAANRPPLGIGDGSVLEKCIVDKDCRIGRNVQIRNRQMVQHADGTNYYIRDGIVILPNSSIVPDGSVI
jgi:glucose-1-phosphate adenylyltransferase